MRKNVYRKFTATAVHINNILASGIWLFFLVFFWNNRSIGIDQDTSQAILYQCAIPITFMLSMQLMQLRYPLWAEIHVVKIANAVTWINAYAIVQVASILSTRTSIESTSSILVIFLVFQSILNPLTNWKYSAINGLGAIICYMWVLLDAGLSLQKSQSDFFLFITIHALLIHASRTYQNISIREDQIIQQLDYEKKVSIVAREEAMHAKKARENFIANISHEIRTPLFGIIGLTNRILNASNDWTIKNVAEKINKSSQHLLSIVNDILDFSELNQKGVRTFPGDVDLNVLIGDASKIIESQIDFKNIQYFVHVEKSCPEEIVSDAKLLLQVLINLLGNAVKYTKSGHITLSIRLLQNTSGKPQVEFSIQDTGVGISKASLKRLFHPFEQGDQVYSKEFSGTGLGLALSKSIVDALGGTIEVHSEFQVGSTFSVKIPYEPTQNQRSFFPNVNGTRYRKFYLYTNNQLLSSYITNFVFDIWNTEVEVNNNYFTPSDRVFDHSVIIIDESWQGIQNNEILVALEELESTRPIRFVFLISHANEKFVSEFGFFASRAMSIPIQPRSFVECVERMLKPYPNQEIGRKLNPEDTVKTLIGKRVLLADDNELNLDILLDNLLGFGFAVDFALDGLGALHLLEDTLDHQEKYACFFIDMQMPGIDGIGVVRKIREYEKYSRTPIFIVTANALDTSSRLCLEAGATDVLVKPFNSKVLEALVKANVGLSNASLDSSTHSVHSTTIQSVRIALRLRNNFDIDVFSGILRSNGKIHLYTKTIPRAIAQIKFIAHELVRAVETHETEKLGFHIHALENSLSFLGANRLISRLGYCRDISSNFTSELDLSNPINELCADLVSLSKFLEEVIYETI